MPGTLRIGFAMGGGVSLGTFNGAALTQTLKLAILRGGFDKVEVDCFSGASAGAMSLAILLRGLAAQTPEEISRARASLHLQYGDEFIALSAERQKDLIAAQVVQDAQERIWVHEIGIDKLLAEDKTHPDSIKHTAGLLNRAAVEKIAHDAIAFPGEQLDLSKRRLLADRVLFGCALTNLTPILADARTEFTQQDIFLQALADGMTSRTHREMRVFDLMFTSVTLQSLKDEDEHPGRWYRYRAGAHKSGKVSDLRTRKAWSTIAATAIASGAFPGAFEPVVLTRHQFEFGNLWPQALQEHESHPFTYSDGGTLNNEPIRECFRMASFLDANKGTENVTRWIVFVDPNVADPHPALQLSLHKRWRLDDPNWLGTFDGWDLQKLSSLDRLLPFFSSLVGSLLNESHSIEGDKIFKTHKRFQLRDDIRGLLQQVLTNEPTVQDLRNLYKYIDTQLQSNRSNLLIPAGGLTVRGELQRILDEERDTALGALRSKLPAFDIQAVPPSERKLWLRALTFVAVDLVMDLTGKSEHTRLLAIAPEGKLPGGAMAGFAGFLSDIPGVYEVEVARYRAQEMLEQSKLVTPGPMPTKPEFTQEQKEKFRAQIQASVPLLVKRLVNLLDDSHLPILPLLPDWVMSKFLRKKLEAVTESLFAEQDEKRIYEFHLHIPGNLSGLEWDGKGLRDRDIKPVLVDGVKTLITFAAYSQRLQRWSGVHVNDAGTALRVDKNRLKDRVFCHVMLPDAGQMKAVQQMPNPVFSMTLDADCKGTDVTVDCWSPGLSTGVVPLEARLFC